MRDFLIFILFFLLIMYILSNCANIKPPTGGPQDTIPPVLIKSIPANKSLNYKETSIKLEYDEYLKIENLNKQLIITPIIDQDYETKIKKYSIELQFPEPFQDSTTYTFNFQNAIKDITEGNVTQDNVIAFSTGNYIDSIQVNGKVKNLFSNNPEEGYTVCLYKADDTLNIFNSKPMYLTRSDPKGKFLIENIKNGLYRIYAYNDLNSNLICDIPKEVFGFIPDTLNLTNNIDSVFLDVFYVDMRPLQIQRSGPSGKYYEIKFNKNITGYSIFSADSSVTFYHNFGEDNKTIRFYDMQYSHDSLKFYLNAVDSINQEITDTLFVKFTESKRSKLDFNYSFSPSNDSDITDQFKGIFTFNKPVFVINSDSLYFEYDSITYQYIPHDSIFLFNEQKDELKFSMELFYSDYLEKIAESDTSEREKVDKENILARKGKRKSKRRQLTFHIRPSAIVSVDGDSIEAAKYQYNKLNEESYGIIRGKVVSSDSFYTIQLVKGKNLDVIDELKNETNYIFNYVEPGEYRMRVFVDNNRNGKWDPGNIFLNIPHETVYIMPDIISIRANWELTDINLEF